MTPTMQAATPAPTAPIEYPMVTIGGRVLVVKADFYAQYLLSKQKVSIADALVAMLRKDPGLQAEGVTLWAACVADNYRRAKEAAPTADEWAVIFSEVDPYSKGKWLECCAAMAEALKKVFPALLQPQAAAAEKQDQSQPLS